MNHYKAKILFENIDNPIKKIEDEVRAFDEVEAIQAICRKYKSEIRSANFQISVEVELIRLYQNR